MKFLSKIINKTTRRRMTSCYTNKYIKNIDCAVGKPLEIRFADGGILSHETVISITKTIQGYDVETTRNLWFIIDKQ